MKQVLSHYELTHKYQISECVYVVYCLSVLFTFFLFFWRSSCWHIQKGYPSKTVTRLALWSETLKTPPCTLPLSSPELFCQFCKWFPHPHSSQEISLSVSAARSVWIPFLGTVSRNGIQRFATRFLLKTLRKPEKLYRNSQGWSNRSRFDSNG